MRSRLRIVVTIVSAFTSGKPFFNISLMSCCGVSAWSISIICEGWNVAICLTISLPILPAEPVISILLPLSRLLTASRSMFISSRGSKSSISISCSWDAKMSLLPSHSVAEGITKMEMPFSMSMSTSAVCFMKSSFFSGEMKSAVAFSLSIVFRRSLSLR